MIQKYQSLLFKNQIGLWEWNLKANKIWFDEGIRALYEYLPDENYIDPEEWYKFIHPDDYADVLSHIMNLLEDDSSAEEKKSEMKTVFRIRTPLGTEKHISTYALKIQDPETLETVLIGLNFDVSENQMMQKVLIEHSKLAHLGNITSGIAHEVNNPLSIIFGKSGLLKSKIEDENFNKVKLLADVDSIQKNSERIAQIIRSLNAFSRNSINDPFQNVSILKIIDQAFEITKDKFKNEMIDFRVLIDKKMNYTNFIEVRESEILHVVLNLLNNSYDAVKGLATKWVEINITESATDYQVLVTDSGVKIKPEIVRQMMEPFFTTKPTGQGTGLGLSLALQIIRSHNGTLDYNSENENTQFILKLKKKIKS